MKRAAMTAAATRAILFAMVGIGRVGENMSTEELIHRVAQTTGPLDWRAIREEIHDEFDKATTSVERVQLLGLFSAVMNLVERNMENEPESLAKFQKARLADYRLLVMKECMVGENVCGDTLYAVTAREIAAGRMASDDSLRTLAEEQMSVPHPSRAELEALIKKPVPKRNFLSRILGK